MNSSEVPESPRPELYPTLDPTAVGAGTGCLLVVLAPIIGLLIFARIPGLPAMPGLDLIVMALLGSFPLAPLVGRAAMGEWGKGTIRAGGVLAIAICAGGGTIFSPIEGMLFPPGLTALGAAMPTGMFAGGVLLRRPAADPPSRNDA